MKKEKKKPETECRICKQEFTKRTVSKHILKCFEANAKSVSTPEKGECLYPSNT